MAAKSAVSKVNWSGLSSSLNLSPKTASTLTSFRSRNADARSRLSGLQSQSTEIDFSRYRSQLKNQSVVDQIEKAYRAFKPVTYDVDAQVSAISKFEDTAVRNAAKTLEKVEAELADLEKTLKNIQDVRSFDELTATDVVKARPDIERITEKMVSRGKWTVPGYKEKFGDLVIM